MLLRKYFYFGLFLIAIQGWNTAQACTCMPEHPQTQYCSADFAIVATPKMAFRIRNQMSYKLKIRNELKMSEKAKLALKAGRLFTSDISSMCGVSLQLNRTYLITGKIRNLQAVVNICNFVKPWKDVNPRQRKGFKVLYKQGCSCKIPRCATPQQCEAKQTNHSCPWLHQMSPLGAKCHANYGVCFLNKNGSCHWGMARKLTTCLHSHNLTKDVKPFGYRAV